MLCLEVFGFAKRVSRSCGFQGHLFVVCCSNLVLITSGTQMLFSELDVAQV